MEETAIVREIQSLPPDAQKQVVDFVAFLKSQYPDKEPPGKMKKGKLTDEPFIGMWQKRKDMQDSTAWVQDLRKREWETKA